MSRSQTPDWREDMLRQYGARWAGIRPKPRVTYRKELADDPEAEAARGFAEPFEVVLVDGHEVGYLHSSKYSEDLFYNRAGGRDQRFESQQKQKPGSRRTQPSFAMGTKQAFRARNHMVTII